MRTKTIVAIGAGLATIAIGGAAMLTIRNDRPGVAEFRSVIEAQLKDPVSAQYRGDALYFQPGGLVYYCGEVNARNALGGYVGFRRFVAGRASVVFEQPEPSPAFDRFYARNCAISR